jgi:hypothetical protein
LPVLATARNLTDYATSPHAITDCFNFFLRSKAAVSSDRRAAAGLGGATCLLLPDQIQRVKIHSVFPRFKFIYPRLGSDHDLSLGRLLYGLVLYDFFPTFYQLDFHFLLPLIISACALKIEQLKCHALCLLFSWEKEAQ